MSCCYWYGISHATANHDNLILGYSELPACQHVEFLAQMIIFTYIFILVACLLGTSKPISSIYACGGVHTQFWHHISGALGGSTPRCFSLFSSIIFTKSRNKHGEDINIGDKTGTILGQWTGWTITILIVRIEARCVQVSYVVIGHLFISSLDQHT